MTRWLVYGTLAVALACFLAGCNGDSNAPDPTPAEAELTQPTDTTVAQNTEPDVVRQDASTTPAPDNAILAAETGLPVEQIDKAIAFQQAFGKYAEELISRFPDQISGVWADSPPGTTGLRTRGHVRFTGKVPPGLTSMENVVLTGGGAISMADHTRRVQLAARAMLDLGYHNLTSSFDPIDKVIRITLKLPEGVSPPSKLDLVGALQDRVQGDRELQGRAATVEVADLELTVITGSGPIFTNQHSRR